MMSTWTDSKSHCMEESIWAGDKDNSKGMKNCTALMKTDDFNK